MTGYGRQEAPWKDGTLVVEIRSVNHRFLDIACRIPKSLSSFEEACKEAVQRHCHRGRVDITLAITGARQGRKQITLDRDLAAQYCGALRDLKKQLRLSGRLDINTLAGVRELVTVSEEVSGPDKALLKLAGRLVETALNELVLMREREGQTLSGAVLGHLDAIEQARSAVAEQAPRLVEAAFSKLKSRVENLLQGPVVDEARLRQEIALLADRSDATEELVRLGSHLQQFRATLAKPGTVGKTLDFLLQEMGREVNTLGSKANDAGIGSTVVQMKTVLEKIREQVQNIE
ncbi:MAG TPA: YicC/YloC family endoribonuclease [Nitrospiraceae bacterium]|nr:YicC/YloC family endoribonuclease [Nitrospiraceae bacterium]